MATIIDSLVVTLGLDASKFKAASSQAVQTLKRTGTEGEAVGKTLEQAGKRGADGLAQIKREALALLGIFTAGMGITSWVKNTIGDTARLGRSASDLNMNAKALAEWQLAAKKAGGTAEGIVSQLAAAQQSVGLAKMGQLDSGGQAFLRFGGDANALRSDAQTYLKAQADVIARLRTQYGEDFARTAAGQMGVTGDSYHFLRQGSAAVDAQLRANEKLAASHAALSDKAERLRQRWLDFQNALEDTAVTVLTSLEPAIKDALDSLTRMAQWVEDHKGDIAAWVETAVRNIKDFVQWADKAAESVGGWKTVLIAFAGLKILSTVAPILSLATAFGTLATSLAGIGAAGAVALPVIAAALAAWAAFHSEGLNENEQRTTQPGDKWDGDPVGKRRAGANSGSFSERRAYLASRLKAEGYTDAQVAGQIGSLTQESGLMSESVNDQSGAAGIAQWLGPRAAKFKEMFGHSVEEGTFAEQVDFYLWEMKNTEKTADKRIRMAKTPEQAAEIHAKEFERPGANEINLDARYRFARDAAANLGGAVNVPPAGAAASAPASNAAVVSNTSTSETNVNGPITINTQATDANAIAATLTTAIKRASMAGQSNTGVVQ
jgi:hypothetical protein